MIKIEGKGGITATIIADSISPEGVRITTFELTYHRYIHSEIMTHRVFSRNAMSSRAVPVEKMIEQVANNPAKPIHWGKNKSGMQADEEMCHELGEEQWYGAALDMVTRAKAMSQQGYHKQIVNRLLEPFQMMKTVITATEWDNFYKLRCHKDAQPEIQELANCMREAQEQSNPEHLWYEEWHTPYVSHSRHINDNDDYILIYSTYDNDGNEKQVSEEEALAISASCCAQVSYRNIDNTYDKAMKIYERLGVGTDHFHASPFEHQAKPLYILSDHVNQGNFNGWVQYRQLL